MTPNQRQNYRSYIVFYAFVVLTITVFMFGTAGCYGRRELEDMSFVTLLGVDEGSQKDLLVTAMIALPGKTSGGTMGSSSEKAKSSLVLTAEGNSVMEALARLTATSSRLITTAHTQLVILGEGIAKQDAGSIMDVFSRNLGFRHNTFIAVSEGPAVDFIKAFQSPEESEPSEYLVKLILSNSRELGTCPVVSMHQFLIGYSTVQQEPWAPFLTLGSTSHEDTETEQSGDSETAKSTPPAKENTSIVTILGAAVFRKTGEQMKMVGTLDAHETMGINILRGDLLRGFFDVALPGKVGRAATLAFQHLSISDHTSLDGNNVNVLFKIKFTASVAEANALDLSVSSEYHQEVVHAAEQELQALLERSILKLQNLGSDVTNLGFTVSRHFKTFDEWNDFNWPVRFETVTANFEITAFILTSGFTISPPSPR